MAEKNWRQLLVEMDRSVQAFLERMNNWVEGKLNDLASHAPYEEASREDEPRAKVVKVADVMALAHLMSAQAALKGLPEVWKNKLGEIVIAPSSRWIAERAFQETIERLPSPRVILTLVKDVFSVGTQSGLEKDIEKQLRALLAPVRAQLVDLTLKQEGSAGRVQDVLTRNPSPPKRRFAKWKSR